MISVIGAGPAGSYYSSLAAKNNEVHLFEEDKKIGRPVACTGILTDNIKSVLSSIPDDLIVANIKRFKIVAPNGKSIYIDLKKKDLILDRQRFDEFLFQKAIDSGAKAHLGEKFLGYRKIGKEYTLKTDKSEYRTDLIVGADGPNSQVAKCAEIFNKRKFIQGLQIRAKYPDLEEGTTIIYLNLGEFSWIVPEDEKIARIGVIGPNSKRLHEDFRKLIKNAQTIEHQSGIIPLYDPKQKLRKGKEDIFLIGDAATQVKATTYGGILYGLLAAQHLAKDKESYVKAFNNKFGKDLWISLKMREMMNSMTEKQSDDLIAIFEKQSNMKILQEHDRDFPSKFMVKLLLKETKLWRLGFGIFKNRLINNKER